MIIEFSVENFGPIKDKVTLSFEASKSKDLEEYYVMEPKKGLRLLKLGIIYGPNASGKTYILRALDFLRKIITKPHSQKTEKFDYQPFLFDQETLGKPSIFDLDFIHSGVRYEYRVVFNKDSILCETLYFYDPNRALVFERNTDSVKKLSKIKWGGKVDGKKIDKDILERNTLWNISVLGAYERTNVTFRELTDFKDWFFNELHDLVTSQTDLYKDFSSYLKEGKLDKENVLNILNMNGFAFSGINISKQPSAEALKTEFLYRFESEKTPYKLDYAYESLGTQRYFQFAGLLSYMMEYPSIFPIDEFESSLHPDLVRHFLLTFLTNVKYSQLIVTTHFRELLMERDILRNDVIWFTEKKEDGSTDLYSLDDFDTSVIRDTSSIFNAYKIGKLGAKPNLGDYYLEKSNG